MYFGAIGWNDRSIWSNGSPLTFLDFFFVFCFFVFFSNDSPLTFLVFFFFSF